MREYLLTILFTCITSISFTQTHEIGIFIGGSNYVGDIGSTRYINPNNLAGGFVYKNNINPRFAVRGTYTFLPISGDDSKSSNPYRKQQGRNFNNNIHELALGIEFNFFDYNIARKETSFTPYILVETNLFNYKKPATISSNGTVSMQNSIATAIPFGLGIKGKLTYNMAYAFETRFRYTFKDDLDYSTNKIPALNFGGNGNDWYLFTGFSLVYTFGRPPCYAERQY